MILPALLSLCLVGPVILPGDDVSLEQAQQKARIIMVAQPTEFANVVGVGAAVFGTLDLKHSTILKGEVKEPELKRVSFCSRGYEVIPTKGEEYLIFIEEYQSHWTVTKMLPKTPENIEAAKKEIQAKKKP